MAYIAGAESTAIPLPLIMSACKQIGFIASFPLDGIIVVTLLPSYCHPDAKLRKYCSHNISHYATSFEHIKTSIGV